MKKVKIDKANCLFFYLKKQKYTVICPVKTYESVCCQTCAWFDIGEGYTHIDNKDGSYYQTKIKTITCKGTPIAELEEII